MNRTEWITKKRTLNEISSKLRFLKSEHLIDENHLETICDSVAEIAQHLSDLFHHFQHKEQGE